MYLKSSLKFACCFRIFFGLRESFHLRPNCDYLFIEGIFLHSYHIWRGKSSERDYESSLYSLIYMQIQLNL